MLADACLSLGVEGICVIGLWKLFHRMGKLERDRDRFGCEKGHAACMLLETKVQNYGAVLEKDNGSDR